MSITASTGKIVVEYRPGAVHGAPALGGYLLKFSLRYEMPPHIGEAISFTSTKAKVFVGPENAFAGVSIPEQIKTYKSKEFSQSGEILYELVLTGEALEEIEKLRVGKSIEFTLHIDGECSDDLNQINSSDLVRFRVGQEEWINSLKSMDYKGGIVFELPMDITPAPEVETALTAIEKAKTHLYYGNYDDVIAKCRIALESIINRWGKIKEVRHLAKTNRQRMTKEERFFNAIDQIINIAHLAHHEDNNREYTSFTRSEAVFVLGATISAVSSYVECKV